MGADLLKQPQLFWLVDSVLSCDQVPASCLPVHKKVWDKLETESNAQMVKLTSAEKVRLLTYGELPSYLYPVPNIASEQNPMVAAVRDVLPIAVGGAH